MSGRDARLRIQLGERDLAVLDSLAELRLLTGKQVQRLHVADGSPITRARRTRALLQRLTSLRLVVRLDRRVGGIRAGSDGHLYGLSGLGQAVLGVGGPLGRRRRSMWQTKPWFQDHVLAVAELAVELTARTRGGLAELLAFDAEPACWRRFTGSGGQLITLKPDAFVRVGLGEFEQRAFLEMDLGSESLPTIERKCRRYVAYWRTGLEQQAHGVFPRVWWFTPTEQRQTGITGVVKRLALDAQALFTVVLRSEAAERLTHGPAAGASS
ncbi:MAG: replication-relaxation family protein [Actinomycetota bacterium]|nr:replication-relaxation family protein [Actinomycetota bacterium]